MFPNIIAQTAFTEQSVDSMFKISGDNMFDSVFMSVLRAVLPPRMGDDSLRVAAEEKDMRDSTCDEYGSNTILTHMYGNHTGHANRLTVINMNCMAKFHEKLYTGFEEKYSGWSRVRRVTEFFKKSFDVLCFINPEIKSTILVIGRADISKVHYLMCSLFAFLPWYFDKETGVSDEEMELMQSLRRPTKDAFLAALQKFEDKYDFYTIKLEALAGFETSWMAAELEQTNRRIEEIISDISGYRNLIATRLQEKEAVEIRAAGLAASMGKTHSDELRDYFIANKDRVRLVGRDNERSLTFEVMSYLTYWDPEFAETLLTNERGALYTERGCSPRLTSADMVRVMRAILIDNTLKMRMCAAYSMDVRGCRVIGLSGFTFGTECANYAPNPHIQRYACLGGYENDLNRMMESHDYIGVMEQCVVSCQSLNLLENPTMPGFVTYLYETNDRIIELPDGTLTTMCGAVEYLNSQKEATADEQDD